MKQATDQILSFLSFSQKLKQQKRTIKLSNDRFESVADHSWHLALMLLVVHPHIKAKTDLLKSMKMALIHDLVEAELGDVPYEHSARDEKIKANKKVLEEAEASRIKDLIGGSFGQEFYDLWIEFENQDSSEARLVKSLDSLEANYQSILFDVDYWDNYFYKIALGKAEKYCEHEEILVELNKEISARMERKFIESGLDVDKIKGGFYDNDPLGDK